MARGRHSPPPKGPGEQAEPASVSFPKALEEPWGAEGGTPNVAQTPGKWGKEHEMALSRELTERVHDPMILLLDFLMQSSLVRIQQRPRLVCETNSNTFT
ncbi:Hypothetical predicted protein [Podarcis lilfordi]|uniref:Uncharacterized protein n=1 Tax=Podarcis lilfordi TaxID=74358 RepID=A0AA35P274_9SAUR|nr:Hypothetical predicted protein [Podarcis lilfordi]